MALKNIRIWRLTIALTLLLLFPGARLFLLLFGSSKISFCGFRTLTGIECPFCGLTRAFASASTGAFSQATANHPAWWIAGASVLFYGVLLISDALTGKNRYDYLDTKLPWLPYTIAGLVFGIGILRYFW